MLLGVDIGGTACKSLLLSEEGEVIACVSSGYALRHPRPGWAEIDPEEWWRAFLQNLRDLSRRADLKAVRAMGVSCTNALLAVDAAGRVVMPAVMFMDQRSQKQCRRMEEQVPADSILKTTGNRLMPGTCAAATIAWAADEQPAMYERAWKFMAPSAWFVYRLTGEAAMDRSRATPTALFDLEQDAWSPELCAAWGIETGKLPGVYPAAAIVGRLTDCAADETGLDRTTVVVTGGTDSSCAALGAGVAAPGMACEVSGTATVLLADVPRPVPDARFMTIHHVIEGQWLAVAPMSAVGSALRWFRREFCTDVEQVALERGRDAYDLLCEEAAASPPGARGLLFLPYLSGERSPIWDSNARGAFCGMDLSHSRRDLVRAILESAGYGLRWNIEAMAERGIGVAELRCVGGQAKSDTWVQVKADITQRRCRVPAVGEASALGAALLAGKGVGTYPDLAEAGRSLVRFRSDVTPRTEFREAYSRSADLYRRLYFELKETFRQLRCP